MGNSSNQFSIQKSNCYFVLNQSLKLNSDHPERRVACDVLNVANSSDQFSIHKQNFCCFKSDFEIEFRCINNDASSLTILAVN